MLKARAYAKINLSLNVLPHRLVNGLWRVKFINCQINLFDELFFINRPKKINLITETKIPNINNNLIIKSAHLLKDLIGDKDLGAIIKLKKKIPIKAGLGGGSSDAAKTLIALAKLWNFKISKPNLHHLAEKLGKDVHYCLDGGICQIGGDGNKVTSIKSYLPRLWLVIITPNVSKPSTAWMYQHLSIDTIGKNLNKYNNLLVGIKRNDKNRIIENLFDDFEELAAKKYSIIKQIKKDLLSCGAKKAYLLGSGLSVGGVFKSKFDSQQAYLKLKNAYPEIIWTHTK